MHTVISAFGDRAAAQMAMDRLAQDGFSRLDMHLEHREAHGDGTPLSRDQWAGMEREVAVGRNALRNFGAFFASLFGADDSGGHVDTYSQHVDRGGFVLVIDAHDALTAQRCNAVLREMGSTDNHVIDRSAHEPRRSVRDIVADRQMTMTGLTTDDARESEQASERERAMARERIATRDKPSR